jgi:hypothetical protein
VGFARLFTVMLALAGLFLLSGADSAWAVHYLYIQHHSAQRDRGTTFKFNAVSQYWAFGPYDTTWSSDGALTPEVQQAILSWQSAVPQLTFVQGAPWNLYFTTGFCGVDSAGCVEGFRLYVDNFRQAEYWISSEIWLQSPQEPPFTSLGKADIFRHEIGHWIGLHEQYNDNPDAPPGPLCSSAISVMNSSIPPSGENCRGVHAPTSWDIDKATRFWKGDNLESPALIWQDLSGLLNLFWTDAMWTEVWHSYGLWYYSWALNQWIPVDSTSSYSSGIGFHKESIPRTMAKVWQLTANGWPRGTYYYAGVSGWSWAFETWSPAVYTILYVP